jgi:glycosyltransferase involved in cell wall biosynthesis
MRLGYLYSRYPVISQTFCDREMLALERLGFILEIGSIHPPLTSLRHEHIARLRAPIRYAPPQKILSILEENAKGRGAWPAKLVDLHERVYGPRVKAGLRARNAIYFADLFTRKGVEHFHVHFANRAAHTALFLKAVTGIPFSVTAHGQDFMSDLGSDDLLREICDAAEFVAAETDYSADLLRQRCPNAAEKIHRVYNGIDLERIPEPATPPSKPKSRILSVGRLVAFKGFEQLIDACAVLAKRGHDFVCEIIGDGPLREALQARIDKANLAARVTLLGSLSQAGVFQRLGETDIFALPSIVDEKGASDIFPTVILEAMASARPVISTRLAGIPELVVDAETGMLISPGDTGALVEALDRLMCQPDLRIAYGRAARLRVEKNFRVEQTIEPLVKLFQETHSRRYAGDVRPSHPPSRSSGVAGSEVATEASSVAYLIDRWPDEKLPLLEHELEEMRKQNVPIVPIVCQFNAAAPLTPGMKRLAESMDFLPDTMVIEAEWRANRVLAQELEETRVSQTERPPAAIFLRQARFALMLRNWLCGKHISHLHATSSRALLCSTLLRELLNLSLSVAIEPRPELSAAWIKQALACCLGGRVSDRDLLEKTSQPFLLEPKMRFILGRRTKLWHDWAELLQLWRNRK